MTTYTENDLRRLASQSIRAQAKLARVKAHLETWSIIISDNQKTVSLIAQGITDKLIRFNVSTAI